MSAGNAHQSPTLIFVYGTLKRGFERHWLLQNEQFLGEAITVPRYRMVNCGSYPGLIEAPDGLPIAGEVWRVAPQSLTAMNAEEGVAESLYRRARVELQGEFTGQSVEAYFYSRSTQGFPDCGERWT